MAVKKIVRVNQCGCALCRSKDMYHPDRQRHYQINLLMSTMNVRQRRLFAAYEAERIGPGGISQVARITGLDRKTIRRGVDELMEDHQDVSVLCG